MAVTVPHGSLWARSGAGHDPLFRVGAVVPIAALLAPIAAVVATATACQAFSSLHDSRQP
jgi:hypothetical protein